MDRRPLILSLALYVGLAGALALILYLWPRPPPKSEARLAQEMLCETSPALMKPAIVVEPGTDTGELSKLVPVRGLMLPSPKGVTIEMLEDPLYVKGRGFEMWLRFPARYPYPKELRDLASLTDWNEIADFRMLPVEEVDRLPPDAQRDYLRRLILKGGNLKDGHLFVHRGGAAKVFLSHSSDHDFFGWVWPAHETHGAIYFDGQAEDRAAVETILQMLSRAEFAS